MTTIILDPLATLSSALYDLRDNIEKPGQAEKVKSAFDTVIQHKDFAAVKITISSVKLNFENSEMNFENLSNIITSVRGAQTQMETAQKGNNKDKLKVELSKSHLYRGKVEDVDDGAISVELSKLSSGKYFIRENDQGIFFISVLIGKYVYHCILPEFDASTNIGKQLDAFVDHYVNIGSKFFLLPTILRNSEAEQMLSANVGSYYITYASLSPEGSLDPKKELRLYHCSLTEVPNATLKTLKKGGVAEELSTHVISSDKIKEDAETTTLQEAAYTVLSGTPSEISAAIEKEKQSKKLDKPIFSAKLLKNSIYCHISTDNISDTLVKSGECLLKASPGLTLYYLDGWSVAQRKIESAFDFLPENGILIPCQRSSSILVDASIIADRKTIMELGDEKKVKSTPTTDKPLGWTPAHERARTLSVFPTSPTTEISQIPQGKVRTISGVFANWVSPKSPSKSRTLSDMFPSSPKSAASSFSFSEPEKESPSSLPRAKGGSQDVGRVASSPLPPNRPKGGSQDVGPGISSPLPPLRPKGGSQDVPMASSSLPPFRPSTVSNAVGPTSPSKSRPSAALPNFSPAGRLSPKTEAPKLPRAPSGSYPRSIRQDTQSSQTSGGPVPVLPPVPEKNVKEEESK